MKEIAKSKIKECFHDISMADESDDNYEENSESMRRNIKDLTKKLDYYMEL
ncbi:hypothetical protein SDC9_145533 [bioreactor metagenome]|uniref:Uncharacterized protein n=1 Tax=bioreactor metagenome TaxID=1076179 RepID=A0A645EB51_9ZZZZ